MMTVIFLFILLAAVTIFCFRAIILTYSGMGTRAGTGITLNRAVELMTRSLRQANTAQSSSDEIRFTIQENGVDTNYIYYLYNPNNTYPTTFNQATYELREASLTGGIGGTFTYGAGQLIMPDILPPPTSDISMSGNIITIDLSARQGSDTVRYRAQVRPRDL